MMEHKGTVNMITKRLLLRRFINNDAEAMFNNWTSDSQVTKYLSWKTHDSIEFTKKTVNEWVSQYESLNYYQWAIVLREEGDEPIGSISVVGSDELTNSVFIGYCIGKKWWNKGISSEALTTIVKFFFEEVNANRLAANHLPRNINSGKVLKKVGFSYEGTMRKATWCPHSQNITDIVLYSLLADEYKILKEKIID